MLPGVLTPEEFRKLMQSHKISKVEKDYIRAGLYRVTRRYGQVTRIEFSNIIY